MSKKIKLNADKVNFCRFEKIGDDYLVTTDWGDYVFLPPAVFEKFIGGKLTKKDKEYKELAEKGFIKGEIDLNHVIKTYRSRNEAIFRGATLHIIVVTLRCNYKCIYCQASSKSMSDKSVDMDLKTAKKVVDFIFSAPGPRATIEFQGGEPLANWPVVKFVVEYAQKKSYELNKPVFFSLVTNLSLMTDDKLKFLLDNKVGLCTSLDGTEKIQKSNRPFPGKDSYKATTDWIKKIKKIEKEREKEGRPIYLLSALITVTKDALKHPKEIIDEYIKWGFTGIYLRPVNYFGFAKVTQNKIGYSPKEYLDFWKKAVDYIIKVNLKGTIFVERGLKVVLEKILFGIDPGFVDLRSPCGAAVGQTLYNYDGKIYTCDEGRMCGDETFLLGNIGEKVIDKSGKKTDLTYTEMIGKGEKTKFLLSCSVLDSTSCDYCVFKPYCGVCPVANYLDFGNIFPQMIGSSWCERKKEMLKYLFTKVKDERIKEMFFKWAEFTNSSNKKEESVITDEKQTA